jgi:hypothetical protein
LINHDEIVARLSAAVTDVALLYAHESDDLFVNALKKMRTALNAGCKSVLPDIPETNSLVREILHCVAIQRHDFELGAGLPPTARTLH